MSEQRKLSRREFAREAVLAAAVAAIPFDMAAQQDKAASPAKPPQAAPAAELSPAAKAEAQQSYQAVMQKYGDRFYTEQKNDIARLLEQQQKAIEAVRAFALDNGDEPGTVLKLVPKEAPDAAR